MNYTIELEIAGPRDRISALFTDPDHFTNWQPSLISVRPLSGEPGKEGSTSLLKYRMGKSVLEMTETILENNLPDRFVTTYETKSVWNKVENDFHDTPGGGTRWIFTSEFRCAGTMRIMAFLFPGMFRKQSLKHMNQFKAYAEESASNRADA